MLDLKPDGSGSRKVVHVLTSLDFGGVEKRVELLARHSEYSRYQHTFYAIGRGGATAHRLEQMGYEVRCLEKPAQIPSLLSVIALYRLFKRVKPQVVHTHGAEANFHGLIAAWLARVPVRIGEEIGIPAHSGRAKSVFRWIYRLAHRVVGISDAVRDWLVESQEVPASKAVRIYNPVELAIPSTRQSDSTRVFRLGFVGRLEPVKNPLALIDAVSALRELGVPAELWIVGDGSQRADIERRIQELELAGHVRCWGYSDTPLELVLQCDLYVQPSLSEGFGIALVEAMSCGVPVLATSVGGAPEIIQQGKTGWLIDHSDAESLTEKIRAIWRQRDLLPLVGDAGRTAVQGRFDPAVYVRRLEALYDDFTIERNFL